MTVKNQRENKLIMLPGAGSCRERPPWRSGRWEKAALGVGSGTPRRAFPTGGTPSTLAIAAVLVLLAVLSRGFSAEPAGPKTLPWLTSLSEAQRQAQAQRKPVLVRVGASWCPACRRLAAEIEKPSVQEELGRWTLVALDADADEDAARELGVTGIPALRIRTGMGELIASQDGFLKAEDLVGWLKQHFDEASAEADAVLLASGEPDTLAVIRLVRQFQQRNPVVRETAIRRLAPYPKQARTQVVRAFTKGTLAQRLAAMELLGTWHAPVEGLDPWQPETLTADRLTALETWAERFQPPARPEAARPSPRQLAEAGRQIDRMLKADAGEAAAIRQRLAGLGAALLPQLAGRLKQAAADQDRQRLAALRYGLVAADSLPLRWPVGLERLAATDPRQRRQAADELARLATAEEQPLLVELFADPDALVREFSLRGLQNIGGGRANESLVKLLADPEPNVRAAVLKQLEEKPAAGMVPKVAEYVQQEKDPDLVVHAIRFLRAAGGRVAAKTLIKLLKHDVWQVRAEAAQSLKGQTLTRGRSSSGGSSQQLQADIYVALLELLDDSDAFVVSRAVEGLAGVDMELAVEPLVRAVARHPEVGPQIVELLAAGKQMRKAAVVELRKLRRHDNPLVRVAALKGLFNNSSEEIAKEILPGLSDSDGKVRTAAAQIVFLALEQQRTEAKQQRLRERSLPEVTVLPEAGVSPTPVGIVTEALAKLFAGPKALPGTAPAAALPVQGDATSSYRAASGTGPATVVPIQENGKEKAKEKSEKPTLPAEKDDPAGLAAKIEPWLKDFLAGKGRPDWTAAAIEPLEKLTQSKDPRERLAAAVALIPLGKASTCLPIVLDAAKTVRDGVSAPGVLPWLLWEDRLNAFREMRAAESADGPISILVEQMAEVPDRRAAAVFWELLDDPKASAPLGAMVQRGLFTVHLNHADYLYNSSQQETKTITRGLQELVPEAADRVATGSELRRVVALAVLSYADTERAVQIARKMLSDPKLSEALRRDAFHTLLVIQPKKESVKQAVAALAGKDASRWELALEYLVAGSSGMRQLRDAIYVFTQDNGTVYSSNEPIVTKPPAGLEAGHVRPLLTHADPLVAARAGYLLAILGDRDGLEPVLRYVRKEAKQPYFYGWKQLAVQAVAAADDATQLAFLKEVYDGLEPYEVSRFYWTIRVMTGPEMLKFRKQIRDEVGMSNLR
jgi:HEAT repeat protein/thiol-disulfide isomerase/thioredoxin